MAVWWRYVRRLLLGAAVLSGLCAPAQDDNGAARVDVHLRILLPAQKGHDHWPPAAIWLKPLSGDPPVLPQTNSHYTLLQKNRMFTPHLLVVPVGGVVYFPNADPFFHNVFSLFNGKRFDLGLYEAGTTREETFSREGVSYIFCNIHPEMSAVILVLGTPYYALVDSTGVFRMRVPAGEYELHVWVEGMPQPILDRFTRRVQIAPGLDDLGVLNAAGSSLQPARHLNKFGQPYDRDSKPAY
jgi:plastocyanin